MGYQLKSQEKYVLGVAIDPSIADQDFPSNLFELELELSSIGDMPRPCASCRREMGLIVKANPHILRI